MVLFAFTAAQVNPFLFVLVIIIDGRNLAGLKLTGVEA